MALQIINILVKYIIQLPTSVTAAGALHFAAPWALPCLLFRLLMALLLALVALDVALLMVLMTAGTTTVGAAGSAAP